MCIHFVLVHLHACVHNNIIMCFHYYSGNWEIFKFLLSCLVWLWKSSSYFLTKINVYTHTNRLIKAVIYILCNKMVCTFTCAHNYNLTITCFHYSGNWEDKYFRHVWLWKCSKESSKQNFIFLPNVYTHTNV